MPAARIVSSVQRADSLRSERSDLSQANKRVSFNRDVDVKHIKQPHQAHQQHQQQQTGNRSRGSASSTSSNSVTAVAAAIDRHEDAVPTPTPVHPFPYSVYKEPTQLSEAELAQEAERIIQQVDGISCTVSPNPLLATYETRSLERKAAKRNNQQPEPGNQWSRTLPAAASTKNQLSKKTKNNIEKNNLAQQQQQQQAKSDNLKSLEPIDERRGTGPPPPQTMLVDHRTGQFVSPAKQNRDAATTPPKYDSGIEMDSRPSVNLIVQQLTEEARQRELARRRYHDELDDDPLAPRLPTLSLIEPDPGAGRTHNRNLPFSYTGGSSPTRLSPLRTAAARFSSPPPRAHDPPPANDVVYAQVKVSRDRSQSPERNIFRSTNGQIDKVPPRAKLDFAQQTKPRRNFYDDDEEEEDHDDLDAIKAKARFLFGDDGESARRLDARNNNQRAQTTNVLNNNNNNNNNNNSGVSYKYSTILKERPADAGRNYTTKIVIGGERPARKYSYEDEEAMENERRRAYRDRSASPEPRIQPVASRVRPYAKSPERYPGDYRTLPLPAKKTNHVASSRLVQEAERGRAAVRNQRAEPTSSRLVQQARYADEYDAEPPKPPVRLKKLSRERAEGSPVRTVGPRPGAKVGFSAVPWRDGSESSPERTPARTTLKTKTYRFRTDTPSPERARLNRWTDEPEPEAVEVKRAPEKEEKIRRQRSKFLSVFLGSKAGKSAKTPTASSTLVRSPSTAKEVRGQAPPVAKWCPDDEADFVRSGRPPPAATAATTTTTTTKGQAHQSAIRGGGAQRPIGQRKSAAPPVPVLQQQQQQQVSNEASRYRLVSTPGNVPPAGPKERRRSSTDRTDTSESEDAAQQRFKSMRQKSQSFNNLNYRPDPAVVLAEEQEDRRRRRGDEDDDGWAGPTVRTQTQRTGRAQEPRDARYRTGALGDARPYASTNLIHQIGRPADVRRQVSAENAGERAEPPGQAKEAPRQMRYFGDTDLESQQSQRGYASRYQPKAGRVTRSASTAAGVGAVRRGVIQRGGQPKQPVSSVNSSESEGSALQSGASAESQRSVYLHATTVADIPNVAPVTNSQKHGQLRDARRKAASREDMSAISGQTGSTLRRTRHISRSYSVLAPWKPRHYRDKFEITYSNQQTPAMMSAPAVVVSSDVGKPPRAPRRQEAALADADEANDGYRSGGGSRQAPANAAVSRSATMPKNTKLVAGWFRKKKQR